MRGWLSFRNRIITWQLQTQCPVFKRRAQKVICILRHHDRQLFTLVKLELKCYIRTNGFVQKP